MADVAEPATESSSLPERMAFDQLDSLVRVTTVRSWVYLSILFGIGVAAVVFSLLYKVPTKVIGEGLLLIEQDRLVLVRSRATGRLADLYVAVGDWVNEKQVIGRVAQEELEDKIREAEVRLAELKRQDLALRQFEEQEKASKDAAIRRLREAIMTARTDGLDKLEIAGRMVTGADKLRVKKYLNDLELLESREKLYDVRDNLNKGDSRLAELELDQVTAENGRERARLERKLKIGELETRLELDIQKLKRTSVVVSTSPGRVAQAEIAIGGLVHEGAPVILLHAPRSGHGVDESGPPYDTIVFVPAGEGKRIEVDNPVEVVPATVKREENGFIRGRVVAISELPATKMAMEAALEHPELVDTFLKRYAPGAVLRVQVKLEEKPGPAASAVLVADGSNPGVAPRSFRWSSSAGPEKPLKTGTMCQASIVVERRRLIRLILPWTRKVVGAD